MVWTLCPPSPPQRVAPALGCIHPSYPSFKFCGRTQWWTTPRCQQVAPWMLTRRYHRNGPDLDHALRLRSMGCELHAGVVDVNGQQLDLRKTNSWLLKLGACGGLRPHIRAP